MSSSEDRLDQAADTRECQAAKFLRRAHNNLLREARRRSGGGAPVTGQTRADWARYWCTDRTALAPSSAAAATRFSDAVRTSPAANTPGTLVS
ncbi:hypothetical protein SUDANB146_01130 [Streptomyces sp. enrichment culture]